MHAETPKDSKRFTKIKTPRTRKSVGDKIEDFKILHLKSEAPLTPKKITSELCLCRVYLQC